MTRDDIIKLAREAGMHLYVNDITEEPYALVVERFAALVAAQEREACAKTCEARSLRDDDMGAILARAIRARGGE